MNNEVAAFLAFLKDERQLSDNMTSLTAVSSLISAPRRREPTSARPRRRPTSTATGGTTSPIRQTAANMPPKAPYMTR